MIVVYAIYDNFCSYCASFLSYLQFSLLGLFCHDIFVWWSVREPVMNLCNEIAYCILQVKNRKHN